MNLLVDIGNTRIKWARSEASHLYENGALVREQHADWPQQLPLHDVAQLFVASVVDTPALESLAARAAAAGVPLHTVASAARVGDVVNAYEQPQRLGVDRWMACLAGHARGAGSVLIADAGTAITLDWVDASGRHGGGLIAPGVANMRGALHATTQLPAVNSPARNDWLARDTDAAIATGTLRCAIALLDNAARDLAPDRLLLTGGEAVLLGAHLAHDWQIAPQLVLEGLARYAATQEGGNTARGASE